MLQGISKRTFNHQPVSQSALGSWTYVTDEIYRQCEKVLVSRDMQIFCQSIQLRIADWRVSALVFFEGYWGKQGILLLRSKNDNK
jgi:hypothetical protein